MILKRETQLIFYNSVKIDNYITLKGRVVAANGW